MKSINPANNKLIREYEEYDYSKIESILQKSEHAFAEWKNVSWKDRAQLMTEVARLLRLHKSEFARLMTEEMGKLPASAAAEVEKCAWVCNYYAANSESFLQDEVIHTDAAESFVSFQPLGTILAIMPWNFPFWQVLRFAAPNLMAGNTGILKHASNVNGCGLAIEDIFRQAGFPEGVFQTILVSGRNMEKIIEHPVIKAVTLTGSTPAGKAVASAAGKVLKKCVLELGGSDPYIIFPDADIEEASRICVTSKLINAGQSCIAAKRFIVVDNVYDEFLQKFTEKMEKQIMGDPYDPQTTIGPLARNDLRDELHSQVQTAIKQGAECILGGYVPQTDGAFYPPTILVNINQENIAYKEELFGPVATIIKAKDETDAVRIANDTSFGLGAALFCNDLQKARKIAREEINAGCCFINDFVKSDPRLPFGGIKESGFGRELSRYGILEFVNIKSVFRK